MAAPAVTITSGRSIHEAAAIMTGRSINRCRSTAEMVERTASMVPGVIHTHADVTWELDDTRAEPASVDPVFPFGPR